MSMSSRRGRSIRQMTGTSSSGTFDNDGRMEEGGEGTTMTRRHGASVSTAAPSDVVQNNSFSLTQAEAKSDATDDDYDPYGGISDEDIVFPESTHTWLFSEHTMSLPFLFAVAIVLLSYGCLGLALANVFENYETDNPFNVPYQVPQTVRIAQYLAMIIALIMEEEIPTGLYLLRMISKDSLHKKFPKISYTRFVLSAIVRLLSGYLFLFNTFAVVVQATAVLDIFYDVLAIQFLQQLDDISFNLAKIDVFGRHLKHAALSKCFAAEFEKEKFSLRKRLNRFIKAMYFLNLFAMIIGLGVITTKQNEGVFYADSISVAFGEDIWNDAIIRTANGDKETRNLLFSYFNGVYRYDGTLSDGRPIYTEQNKFDHTPFITTVPAEVKYCESEKAWVFAHDLIRKSDDDDESDCPWLLRSPQTEEYNPLDVTGDWTIWTGSIQQGGRFSVVDNKCNSAADCNYHGVCGEDGQCICSGSGLYYGLHCEHKKACGLVKGGESGIWSAMEWPDEDVRIYQGPVYYYLEGLPEPLLQENRVDAFTDQLILLFTGSRWLGLHYPGTKLKRQSRDVWKKYILDYHAFWRNSYNTQTKFASDPHSTSTSIIGIDFYMLGQLGEEHGPWGELFPLSDPPGSGFMRCIEDTNHTNYWDILYIDQTVDFSSIDGVGTIDFEYELKVGSEWEAKIFSKDCTTPIYNIINQTMEFAISPKHPTHNSLTLRHTFDKSQLPESNVWNTVTKLMEVCHLLRVVEPADASKPKTVLAEKFTLASGMIEL